MRKPASTISGVSESSTRPKASRPTPPPPSARGSLRLSPAAWARAERSRESSSNLSSCWARCCVGVAGGRKAVAGEVGEEEEEEEEEKGGGARLR